MNNVSKLEQCQLIKQFRTDGVCLRVQSWSPFLDQQHFINKTFQLASALFQDIKLFVHIWSVEVVTFSEMFPNSGVPMFNNALK